MIKQRIRALERKFARELAEIAAEKIADEQVTEWEQAKEENRPAPDPWNIITHIYRTCGWLRHTANRARFYLMKCNAENIIPDRHALFLKLRPDRG